MLKQMAHTITTELYKVHLLLLCKSTGSWPIFSCRQHCYSVLGWIR